MRSGSTRTGRALGATIHDVAGRRRRQRADRWGDTAMTGTVGCAPSAAAHHPVRVPRRHGRRTIVLATAAAWCPGRRAGGATGVRKIPPAVTAALQEASRWCPVLAPASTMISLGDLAKVGWKPSR
jgi:hypothetical protein